MTRSLSAETLLELGAEMGFAVAAASDKEAGEQETGICSEEKKGGVLLRKVLPASVYTVRAQCLPTRISASMDGSLQRMPALVVPCMRHGRRRCDWIATLAQ